MLVCVPLTAHRLRALAAGELADVAAHAPVPSLFAALELGPDEAEDADFSALTYASVSCLREAAARIVATAEVPGVEDARDDVGTVRVARLPWGAVTGIYVDEPRARPLVVAAHDAARPAVDFDAAWDEPAVQHLLAEADLLWYGPEELDDVLATTEGE